LYFGSAKRHRFDDPEGVYGVLYVARSAEGAFVETFLRFPAPTLLSRSDLDDCGCATMEVVHELRLVPLHGKYLVHLGATAQICHGPQSQYDLPRLWSRAIYEHADAVDGIEYKSRHNDDLLCCALFDRTAGALAAAGASASWTADATLLGTLLNEYDVALA
jgi:hypothetical protein